MLSLKNTSRLARLASLRTWSGGELYTLFYPLGAFLLNCGSFQSKRYFGSQNDFVRRTRRVPAIPFDY
jgi:hypothetical protein